jgi:hypothetical protein
MESKRKQPAKKIYPSFFPLRKRKKGGVGGAKSGPKNPAMPLAKRTKRKQY